MTAAINTLCSFNGPDGANPEGDLIADSNGDLFGTTGQGGANGLGTVFEIARTAGGYASTPTTLVSFTFVDGKPKDGSLAADADGDLFGTTLAGGSFGEGNVFEIVKSAGGYATTPTTLVSFNGFDGAHVNGGLIADAKGDLFGTTVGDSSFSNSSTVFEIAKTAGGYASTPTTLTSFDTFAGPEAGLIADANGDLFGSTFEGGAGNHGTVFEIAKTAGGYASTRATLVNFTVDDGPPTDGSLVADARGDLFGTSERGGPFDEGDVFEIAKTASGYANTPITLASFNGISDGSSPLGNLIVDANGDLFGTTPNGGPSNNGTVFEIKNTAAGYASTPITVASFNGADGSMPVYGLIADSNGDLFGTTSAGGPSGDGTAFEITNSGYVTAGSAAARASDGVFLWNTDGQAAIWGMDGTNVIAGGTVNPNPGPSWFPVGTADFNSDGHPDILWQNRDNGQAAIWDMNGTSLIGGGTVSPNPGPSWHAIVHMGDFNGDGHPDILWQNGRRTGRGLGHERDHRDRRRDGQPQSRAKLVRGRNGRFQCRRSFRHPVAEPRRTGRDLGDERKQCDRRRAR
jgi:uncharacterized repeat protein (TIGR03803 family)